MARCLGPCADTSVPLLLEAEVFNSPDCLIQYVGYAVSAFGQVQLPIDEISWFEQIHGAQIADYSQMLRAPVPVPRVMPAAWSIQRFRDSRRILRNKLEMLHIDAFPFRIHEAKRAIAFAVVSYVRREISPYALHMASWLHPVCVWSSLGDAASLVVKSPGVHVE